MKGFRDVSLCCSFKIVFWGKLWELKLVDKDKDSFWVLNCRLKIVLRRFWFLSWFELVVRSIV